MAWACTIGGGVSALLCLAGALLAGFAGVVIGSDEAMAAQPYFAAALGLLFGSLLLLAMAVAALVQALRARRARSRG